MAVWDIERFEQVGSFGKDTVYYRVDAKLYTDKDPKKLLYEIVDLEVTITPDNTYPNQVELQKQVVDTEHRKLFITRIRKQYGMGTSEA